jgi:hypothetical protein
VRALLGMLLLHHRQSVPDIFCISYQKNHGKRVVFFHVLLELVGDNVDCDANEYVE